MVVLTRIRLLMAIALACALLVAMPSVTLAETATQDPPAQSGSKADSATSKESAAKKPAKPSIENEKLDPKLFDDPEAKKEEAKKDAGGGGAVWRMIFGLIVVIGAIYGVHAILKKAAKGRLNGGPSGSVDGMIEVLASTPLAQGRMLHVVRLGDEVAILGATEQSITRVGTLAAEGTMQTSSRADSGFSSVLNGAMTTPAPYATAMATGLQGTASALGTIGGISPQTTTQPTGPGTGKGSFWNRFVTNLQMMTSR